MLNEGEQFSNPDAIELLSELVKSLKPSLREIEQILSYFALIQNMAGTNQTYYPSYQLIFAFICYLKASKPELIDKIVNDNIDAKSLIQAAGIVSISGDTEYNHIDYLSKLITFDLASEEVRNKMIEEKEIFFDGYDRIQKNIMQTVCSWLSEMHIN